MSLNQKRISKLRAKLSLSGFDAVFILNPSNTFYLLNSDIEVALYVSQSGSNNLIVSDSRYKAELGKIKAPGFKKILRDSAYADELVKVLKSKKNKFKVALESGMPLADYIKLKKLNNYRFVVADMVSELREIKDAAEIENIEEAVKITKDSLDYVASNIKSGMTELEVEGLLELEFRKRGASGSAFPAIVASGARSAMPHAKPSVNKVRKRDGYLLIDSGAIFNGYCADLTRIFFWDKISKAVKEAYGVVEEVREYTFASLSDGVRISEVAAGAEELIEERGFSSAVRHGLGHGVGINVHERPSFSKNSKEVFKENMVLTVEPGLYFPGVGGVRIEDVVVIKKKGVKVL